MDLFLTEAAGTIKIVLVALSDFFKQWWIHQTFLTVIVCPCHFGSMQQST